jgi:hypothetical protein
VGDESFHKFDVPVAGGSWVTAELPLAAIYLLAQGPELRIEPMTGGSGAEAVIANTYRGSFLADPVAVRVHFETAVKLVGRVPLFRCERVWGHELLDVQATAVVDHFRNSLDPISAQTP